MHSRSNFFFDDSSRAELVALGNFASLSNQCNAICLMRTSQQEEEEEEEEL